MEADKSKWVQADFNGLFSELLCLSHKDFSVDFAGNRVELQAGMKLTAYQEDGDENNQPDDIFASGVVEPSPEWLVRHGSRWALRIDSDGVRHESDLRD